MINNKSYKGKPGRRNTYSNSFKLQIALEYINGDESYPQVASKYDLSEKVIEYFVRWYKKNDQQIMQEDLEETVNSSSDSNDITALKKKLVLAEMKIVALEKVIAIANEDYRTDLKKKAATK